MPAATTKTDLLSVHRKEWQKLETLIASIPAETALTQDNQGTSIKDVIGHRAHWISLFLGWYAEGQEGKEVDFPAPGYKWSELKRYNADLKTRQAGLDWQEAVALLAQNHTELTGFLNGLSQDALYGGPMKGAKNNWATGRWAEAAGPSHYRSAAKFIRARLKAATNPN